MKKNIMRFISFLVLLLMCSCQMKINGNFISLENALSFEDTLDAFNFPMPKIKQLYFTPNADNPETVDIIFNNGYTSSCKVWGKEVESNSIEYNLGKDKTLSFRQNKYNIFVTYSSNLPDGCIYTDYQKYSPTKYYVVSSISYSRKPTPTNAPSFNDIQSYKRHGEIIGSVKSVSHSIFERKQMFGKDSLLFCDNYTSQYDKDGNLIFMKKKNRHIDSYLCEYDKNGNVIFECIDNELKVKYEDINRDLSQTVSYYKKNKVAYRNMIYNSNKELKECDYYEDYSSGREFYLDRKIKYDKGSYFDYKKGEYIDCIYGVVYDSDGGKKYTNKYNLNYSILEGRIDLGCYAEYYNPYERYRMYDSCRDILVTDNEYNTQIEIKYPYSLNRWERAIDENQIYNSNCNLVKKGTKEYYYDGRRNSTKESKYIILYKYDAQGNWVERHSVLMSYKENGEDANTQLRGFIEYRDIDYFNKE